MRDFFFRAGSLVLTVIAVVMVVLGLGLLSVPRQQTPLAVTNTTPKINSTFQVDTLAGKKVLRIGADQHSPPYAYLIGGRPGGFDVDLIRAVAEAVGLMVEVRTAPRTELADMLANGELDVLVGMGYSPDDTKDAFQYSKPYAVQSMDLFVHNKAPYLVLDDVIGKDILVKEGSILHAYLRRTNFAGRIVTVNDIGDALRLLSAGEYDAALLPEVQALHQIDQIGLANLRSLDVEFEPIQYGFAVRKGDNELLLQLNEGLNIVHQSGEFDRIHDRWFGVFERRLAAEQVRQILVILGFVVLLLLGALAWNWTLNREVRARTSALRKSEEEYRLLVDNASEGVVVVCDNRLVFINPRGEEILGFSREELVEMDVNRIIHVEDREAVLANPGNGSNPNMPKEQLTCRIVPKNGDERWILFNTVDIEWEGKPAFLNLFSEITQVKQAEQRIKRQLQQMAALRAVDMAIAGSTDLHRTLRLLLEQVTAQLGVDAADVLLLDRQTRKLRYAADFGFRTTSIKTAELGLGEGYAGIAAKHRHPVHIALLRGAPKDMLSAGRLALEGFYGYYGTPLIAKGEVLGVLEIYHRAPLKSSIEWMDLIETMAHQAAIAINNAELFEDLEQANEELVQAYDRTIEGWARVLEMRDGETEGHSQRVTELTIELARRVGYPEEDLVQLRRGALLHDMGKMGIPDSILLKKGPLSPQEWQVMRQHPVYAYEMLSRVEFLQPALDIPYYHHERWDGTGYPRGLKEEEIPLAARIFSIVDVWDALRVPRPYRDAWPIQKIWTYVIAESGKQFDPEIVSAFIEMMRPELQQEHKRRQQPLAAD